MQGEEQLDAVTGMQGKLIRAAFDLKTHSERPINFVEDLLVIEQKVNTVNEAFRNLKDVIT